MHTEAVRPTHREVRRLTAAVLLQARTGRAITAVRQAGRAIVQARHTAEAEAEAEVRQAALTEEVEAEAVREDSPGKTCANKGKTA